MENHRRTNNTPGGRGSRRAVLLVALLAFLPGCMSMGWPRQGMDFGERLQPNVTKPVLVARINENADRLQSWRSTASVKVAGALTDASAEIAVERPRNFRMRATSVRGEEADIGSNHERLWFWFRDGGRPEVVTVRHEDVGRVQLPIPFQPDWLMEVLGIVQLDPNQMTLQPVSGNGTMSLISEGVSPGGQPVTRIIDVEPNYGLILAHRLYDAGGLPIASAKLDQHWRDPASGAILPRTIEIDWPQARMSMRLRLGRIEVNPASLPESLWQVPTTSPQLDLSRQLPRPSAAAMPPRPPAAQFAAAPRPHTPAAPSREEPPWDESAVASAVGREPDHDQSAGRARVTIEQTRFLPPRRSPQPILSGPPGRATLY